MNSKIEYFKNNFSKIEDNFYILDKNDAYVDKILHQLLGHSAIAKSECCFCK